MTYYCRRLPSNDSVAECLQIAYLSSLLGEITIGVVVGVLRDVGVGVDGLHPVQQDHQSRGGKTLKYNFCEFET